MTRFFKQKGLQAVIYLLAALSQPLSAQTILSQWDRGSLSLRMSPALKPVIEPILPKVAAGMTRVSALMSQRSVSKPLTIWLLKDEAERGTVLLQMGYPPAAPGKYIRSSDQLMVIVSPQADNSWLLRFIMGEYSRYLLFSGSAEDGMEWYRTGLATLLGWFSVEEQEGGDWNSNVRRVTRYYKFRLSQSDVSVEDLMKPGGWKRALAAKDRTQIIARSVLYSAWVCEKAGPAGGLSVLYFFERTRKIDEALRTVDRTFDQLKEQEKALNASFPDNLKK